MAKKIDYTNAYTAYEDAMNIGDDTRLISIFGDDLIWRNHLAEQEVRSKKIDKARTTHERRINFYAILSAISYIFGAPLIAYLTHSFLIGVLAGLTPYFALTAYSILKRDDTFLWQLLPAMFTTVVGCFMIFIHTIFTLMYSLHV